MPISKHFIEDFEVLVRLIAKTVILNKVAGRISKRLLNIKLIPLTALLNEWYFSAFWNFQHPLFDMA
jgi:hypothetical protein